MKKTALLIFLLYNGSNLNAQTLKITDSVFQFNKRFSQCENKWVVFPKSIKNDSYSYGFIYVDASAGFTFNLEGNFKIENNELKIDTSFKEKSSYKTRLARNTKLVSLLPRELFKAFNIREVPDWLRFYNSYTDTLARLVRWGYIYNALNECEIALTYLGKAQKINPHAKGLEFELTYAYNDLARYDEAIKVLESAIENDPKNVLFYRESGFAYMKKLNYDKAIAIYQKGINMCSEKELESKSEMALNLAQVYKKLENEALYKTWILKAKECGAKDSKIYNYIIQAGY